MIVANETFIEVDFQYVHYFDIEREVENGTEKKQSFLDGTGCFKRYQLAMFHDVL